MSTKVQPEELTDIGLKRAITHAGRLSTEIAPKVAELDALNKRIKHELLQRLENPGADISMVSGEYIASLSAEKRERDITEAVKRTIIGDYGMDRFIESASIPAATLKKLYKGDALDTLAPQYYSGSGRAYKLSKRT